MQPTDLSQQDRETLLHTARASIQYGLQHHQPAPIEIGGYSKTLQTHCASFVTLQIHQQLRGCIGTLEAYQPLIKDVSNHAYAAAFQDPRFSALSKEEETQIHIDISVLTPAELLTFNSEVDLIQQIRSGQDGLILEEGAYKGTFLPSVWESLPQTDIFLRHLKQKAGLSPDYWSNTLRVYRYQTIMIEE
ncbi:MAG: AmmeMemoRadiSam system protein A [Gammaproteobacteria bacterium]|nr:AmmeMemoRadiSam system protein A [Gammaproteobacteria bacterium]